MMNKLKTKRLKLSVAILRTILHLDGTKSAIKKGKNK